MQERLNDDDIQRVVRGLSEDFQRVSRGFLNDCKGTEIIFLIIPLASWQQIWIWTRYYKEYSEAIKGQQRVCRGFAEGC